MSKINLLLLQILVAVVAIGLWHVLSTYPVFGHMVLPPFFFSNPLSVANQVVAWFITGVIWKHLWVTLSEALLAFVIGSIGGVLVGFWFARQPRTAAVFDPYVKMVNALPRCSGHGRSGRQPRGEGGHPTARSRTRGRPDRAWRRLLRAGSRSR